MQNKRFIIFYGDDTRKIGWTCSMHVESVDCMLTISECRLDLSNWRQFRVAISCDSSFEPSGTLKTVY